MTMDLTLFTTSRQALELLEPGKADGLTGPMANFNSAALRVGWLNTTIGLALAAPAAVLATALTVEPVFEEGKWLFDYSVVSGADEYSAVLSAWFDGNLKTGLWLNLEMAVTCTACKVKTEDYLWYSGRFHTEEAKGHWQFFNPEIAQDDQKLVRIDYQVTDATHATLDFTNNRTDGHEGGGDTVAYAREGDLIHISVHDESDALDYDVEWSITTKEGYLQVPGYNEGEMACWDSNRLNVDCQ